MIIILIIYNLKFNVSDKHNIIFERKKIMQIIQIYEK